MSSDIYTNIEEDNQEITLQPVDTEQFLKTLNCLSEFSEEYLKNAARNNIEVYKKEAVDALVNTAKENLNDSIRTLQSQLRVHTSSTLAHEISNTIALTKLVIDASIQEVAEIVENLANRILSLESLNIEQQFSNVDTKFDNYYTKRETREICGSLIEDAIEHIVPEVVDTKIARHSAANDPHGTYAKVILNFVSNADLSTIDYTDVPILTSYINNKVAEAITHSNILGRWLTKGPVMATVGLVPEGTDFEDKALTLQLIMDRIFYNRGELTLIAPEYVLLSSKADLTILIPGNTDNVTQIKLYQDGNLIKTFTKTDIVNGEIATKSNNIFDSEAVFLVELYSTTTPQAPSTATATVKTGYIGFAGVDYWAAFPAHNSWEYLERLKLEGKGEFFGPNPENSVTSSYSVYDVDNNPFEFFILIPRNYGTLISMQTPSQEFGLDAFDVDTTIIDIPVEGNNLLPVLFDLYVYKEKIYRCNNLEVTYNIQNNE